MEILLTLLVATIAFVSTNLDDLFILITFFARRDFNRISVVLGQYIGFSSLIIISSLAYFFKFIIPPSCIVILGVLPILIGINKLLEVKKDILGSKLMKDTEYDLLLDESLNNTGISANNTFQVAAVTFTNGADNIGVYAPLFASMGIFQILLTTASFMVMIGLWCIISYLMVNNSIFGNELQKYGHIVLPFVLIFIGLIIIKGGWTNLSLNI